MGSSDLNLKKSWHVGRAANITATAKAEAAAIEERKKTAARLAEIREERKKEEIQKQLAATTGKVVQERVEWMYSGGPSDGNGADSAASEAYLLGKRSLTNLLQDQEAKKLSKQQSADNLPVVQAEQQAYEAVMNDPIRRRQLLAQMGIEDSKQKSSRSKDKEERRHKHRHHHRRHHDSDEEDSRRERKRRRSRSRDRSPSPRRHKSDDEDRRRSRRRRDSPDERKRRDSRDERNRRSSYSRETDHQSRDSKRRDPSRSRSPPAKRRETSGSRSPPRRRNDSRDRYSDRRNNHRDRDDGSTRDHARPRHGGYREGKPENQDGWRSNGNSSRPINNTSAKASTTDEEERAAKLARMQAAASDLDTDRERRLKQIEEAERAAREADEKARQRNAKIGGDRHFMNSLHKKAGDIDLAERLGRVKGGLVRDEE
ncbi:RNA-splicing factor [Coniochaeta pulveracea]|uniref:RNA-splicing factor n=1 Tax=Coniochaeta pulveracea TaxID=177199 RepID=A0A420Y5Q0_9PEZI|nr:RNA-splicing factor [Coniochaeta pulveracea]